MVRIRMNQTHLNYLADQEYEVGEYTAENLVSQGFAERLCIDRPGGFRTTAAPHETQKEDAGADECDGDRGEEVEEVAE